jgi:tellurite resistance protein TerC
MKMFVASTQTVDLAISPVQWTIIVGYVLVVLAFDRLVLNRRPRELTLRQSLLQTAFFVSLSQLFGVAFILPDYGLQGLQEYVGLYAGELSLSFDNLFILMIILKTCGIPRALHQKALYWGINIAILLRAVMIIGGTAVLSKVEWLMLGVAAYMIYVGISQLRSGEDDDITQKRIYRLLTRIMPLTYRTYGSKLFIRQGGKVLATLFLLAICLIGSTDAAFALDSIPTAIALSTIMFVTVTGNINGVLGLRPMYFLMEHITKYITRLNWGLASICCAVGFKLITGNVWLVHEVLGLTPLDISIGISLGWIFGSLVFAYVAGLVWPPKVDEDATSASDKPKTMVRVYLDCGAGMDGEWESGLMERYLAEVMRQARYYDSVGNVPVFGFGQRIEPYSVLSSGGEVPSQRSRRTLGVSSDLALVLRHAKVAAETTKSTHVVIAMTAGVTIGYELTRQALRDMPDNTFVIPVRVANKPGGAEFLQELDDLLEAEQDRCNTVHATDDTGQPKHHIESEIGEELDEWLKGRDALPSPVA